MGVYGSGFKIQVIGLAFKVEDLGLMVYGLWFELWVLGFSV
jgi:hypothetical protein